ncbi:MAG: AAA family ATPase [Candidatus Kapabacteria bacterium]|nr:AAA family ATPase [Candidatus Kapabacteria bacterium]MBX7154132.1 ATP-binding protein [Bacteroidota bacterium]
MEMIIFCGIQATGKTTFYKEKFFDTHIRISLDQLNTRNKERKLIETCLAIQHPVVIDNTNPTIENRSNYIIAAKENKYKVVGYYFQSKLQDSMLRNSERKGKKCIPEVGIKSTFNKLELPVYAEGFDELYYVEIEKGEFKIKDWTNEI